MAERYARYSLAANPFYHKLNPLERPEDNPRFARVAGFGAVLDRIDALVTDSVANNKPAVILICGGSGSGRGAVASYAMAKYRELRKLPANRFLVPEVTLNNSSEAVFRSWIIELGSLIQETENLNIGNLKEELGARALGAVADNVLLAELRRLAALSARTLLRAQPPAGFGVLLKAIPAPELFTNAVNVFGRAPTILVATAAVDTQINGELAACQHPLRALTPADIPDLVNKLWTDFGGAAPCPFAENGLKVAFAGSHAIERVLVLIGRVLDSRLASFPRGQVWPEDRQLELDEEYIKAQVGILERDWRAIS